MGVFKIATFNVNSIRSRMHIVAPWVNGNSPDVFCLQETRVDNEGFPEGDFLEMGYHVVFSGGKKGRNGVAIVSKEKPIKNQYGFPDDPRDEDRLLISYFTGLTVINTYVPQGRSIDDENYRYKLRWFDRFEGFLENNLDMNSSIIWCGDLNVAPEDVDVHSPDRLRDHVCFHRGVKEKFENVKKLGFVDIFRLFHPNEKNQYTYFDYRTRDAVKRNLGWRVDHILGTKKIADVSINSYIDIKPRLQNKPSDHTVLIAEFKKNW